MSDCSLGDVSVSCPGGCGLICVGNRCYGWCEPVVVDSVEFRTEDAPALVPPVVRVDREANEGKPPAPAGSDAVKLCAHDLSPDALIAGLGSVLETELEPAGVDAAKDKQLPFTGTVDELLDHLELRRKGAR